MSKHVIERWLSQSKTNGWCKLHRSNPVEKEAGFAGGVIYDFDVHRCRELYGFVPDPGKYKKVRITVEELPPRPPQPRLCWFANNEGLALSGFQNRNGRYYMKDGEGFIHEYSKDFIEKTGITVHWYDEEETCDSETPAAG